jgi:hypothetical protein
MSGAPFGNDPAKLERYRAFWNRAEVARPLVGFTLRGWLPLEEYAASRNWPTNGYLTPAMIRPEEFLDDEERLLREGEVLDDDLIRGDSPAAATVPWLSGMLGSRLRILPGNILGEERMLSWEEMDQIQLDPRNPWLLKYLDFADVLVARAQGRFPVSHGAFIGASDILAELRGHTQSILDLLLEPEEASRALFRAAEIFQQVSEIIWNRLPRFGGGYFDGMYQLWAPGPILRMQEDASGVYSPGLYRQFLQPLDRQLACSYPNSFIHLHSTSMFLLDAFLEIEELGCFEINNDVAGPPLEQMIPWFRMVQSAGRSLLIRGSFAADQVRLLTDNLSPRGLFLLIMVKDQSEAERLRPLLGM